MATTVDEIRAGLIALLLLPSPVWPVNYPDPQADAILRQRGAPPPEVVARQEKAATTQTIPEEYAPHLHPHSGPEDALPTVGELLRLEADQALALARRRSAQAAAHGEFPPPQAAGNAPAAAPGAAAGGGEPRLLAIYGVGRQVRLLLQQQGHAYLYQSGKPGPEGFGMSSALPAELPQLQAVEGNCARFLRQEQSLVLCLPQGQTLRHMPLAPAMRGRQP